MASSEVTTLVCLFHHRDRAQAAMEEVLKAGVNESSVSLIGGDGSGVDALDKSELAQLEMPDKDYDHLKEGVGAGGTVLAVQSVANLIDAVESIFKKYSADKIDEADVERTSYDATPMEEYGEETLVNEETPDETRLVTSTELTSEPFKSAGAPYPGTVRLYRFTTIPSDSASRDSANEPDDLDRLP